MINFVDFWRKWGWWLLPGLLLLAPAALAQGVRQPPARVKQQGSPAPAQAPTNESKANPLTPKQLEEALRLLLQVTADSSGTEKVQRGFEIDGLVVDETISKLGRDFYSLFYTSFEAPAGSGDYVVTITEKPARGTSILITVAVNDIDLLEMPLQPNEEYIEAAASEAVGTVTQHLIENNRLGNELEQGNRQPLEVY
ncbi:CsgE family curli-type amyloid fiber assembly protein [Hymenobacter aerophilus]|uniref:CsgE family curli-type amyloid fiber assembly protein n=1 Tax=Hymenobacter aerophilus TaxID=119644 RepID=UPI0003813F1A|nr:CsgE family curli-type amyloid fiber assembly protein [Hymenobacter aerophilus]